MRNVMRKGMKQFISTALAVTMALTSIPLSPITAYATNTGDTTLENSAGQKDGGSSVTTGGDWANDFGGNQGIRISLVSANDPREVVSIGLDGHTRVVDIIFGTEAQYHENCEVKQGRAPIIFTSTKAQELSTTINNYKQIYLTDYLLKLATDSTNKEVSQELYKKLTSEDMANVLTADGQLDLEKVRAGVEELQYENRWLFNQKNSKSYTTNGNKLRDWLLSNAKGEKVDIGLSAEQATTSTVLADGSTKTLNKTTTADKRSNGANSKKDTGKNTQTVTREQTASFLEECLTKANEKYSRPMDYSSDWRKNREDCKSWVTSMNASLENSFDNGKISYNAYLTYRKAVSQIDGNNKKNYNTMCQRENNQQRRLNLMEAVFDKLTGTMTVYGAESTTSASDTAESSAPATEEEVKTVYEKQLLNHLSYILQLSDENNNPYFITKDMLDEKGNIRKVEDGSRNMTVFDPALEDKTHTEFRIMVEPLDWFTPHNTAGKPVHGERFYGTLTNIAQAFDKGINQTYFNNGLSEHLNRNTFNKVSWCAMTVGNIGDDLEKAFNGKFIFDPVPDNVTGAGKTYRIGADIVPNRFLADSSHPYMHEGEERLHQLGWGVQVYWPKPPETVIEAGTTSTWDGTDKPAPSPKTDGKPTPLKVAKWYYTEDNVTNTETVTAVKVQSNSNSPISIKNEDVGKDDLIWEVAGWSTGLSDSVPADNDTTTTYEQYSDNNKGTYAGTEPTILTLEKEDPDKVLYVKLVAKPLSTSVVDIVKVFEKPDDSNPTIAVEKDIPLTEGQEYNPTDSRGTYTENIQSADPSKSITIWDDILDQGLADDGNPIIKERDTKTIYIHYNGTPSTPPDNGTGDSKQTPLLLHEDELSYGYTLRDLRRDGTLAYWQESFKSMAGKVRYCSGHEKERSDGSTYTVYCSYRSRTIDDNFYSLRANLPNSNPNFIADIAEQEDGAGIGAWTINGFKGIAGGLTARNYPNASFLLYRNKDKDRVTLYPGKNDASTKSFTNKLGITAESYTPAHTRIAQDGTGSFKDTFNVNFNDSGTDRTLSWVWRGSRGCTASGSWNSTASSNHSLSDVNNAYTFTDNVRELYELGTAGTGTTVPEKRIDTGFSSIFKNNLWSNVSQDGEIKFYPYVKMVYNDKNNASKPVYVTSENVSTIPAFTKIETGVWKNNQYDADAINGINPVPNVNIITDMWSTSGNSMIFKQKYNIADKRIILPGGSAFDVRMNDVNTGGWTLGIDAPKTSTKLGYRVWSVCVDDSQAGLMASGTTAPTLSNVKQRVTELDQSVKDTVPQYGLAQIVSKGIIDYKGYLKNMVFNNSKGYTFVPTADATWGDVTLSTDRKYYLRLAGINMGAEFNSTVANFDLIAGGIKLQELYKVSSDTSGNVTVTKDGVAIGTLRGDDRDVARFISSNSDIKQLDYATGIVTNYVQAIDRQKGSNRNGEKWYSEAFDGVSVLMSYLSYDIGFGQSIVNGPSYGKEATNTRLSVLDPRLSGKLASKGDLYNFDEETADDKVRSTMFVTAKISDIQIPGPKNQGYVVPQEPDGHFGTFKLNNGEQWEIMLPDMKGFAYSKMFYIPNATVSDLDG